MNKLTKLLSILLIIILLFGRSSYYVLAEEAAPAEEEAGAPETLEVEEAVAEAEPEETKAA